MYRRSTPAELRAIGVPHRVVSSPWYRSSNTRCVHPEVDGAGYDHERAKRDIAGRYDRALERPQDFRLTGDGDNAARLYGGHERDYLQRPRHLRTGELKAALAEARWKDFIDAQIARRREMTDATPKPNGKSTPPDKKTLEAILIDEGFVPNRYLLEINHSLHADAKDRTEPPWNYPSRLMEAPVECNFGEDGLVHVGLMHPAIGDHPFVKRLAEAIKPYRIAKNGAPSATGYFSRHSFEWFHAIDMLRTRPWQELFETRRFTSDPAIIRAAAYALDYPLPHYGIAEAQELLAAMKVKPPKNAEPVVKMLLRPEMGITSGGDLAINVIPSTEQDWASLSWLWIWGIDAQWFVYNRRKNLCWSQHGQEMWHAVCDEKEAA